MQVKDLKEAIRNLSDDEPIWFWVTTKKDMDERIQWIHYGQAPLTKEEYENLIQMLEVDDGLVKECFSSEDHLIERVVSKRNQTTEGNK